MIAVYIIALLFQDTSVLQFIFGQLLLAMIVYFVVSIINSMAQQYAKRQDEARLLSDDHSSENHKTN